MACQHERTSIVNPMEDPLIQSAEHPFCSDPTCPCHEDQELLSDVAHAVEQGLLTPTEATRFVKGKAF